MARNYCSSIAKWLKDKAPRIRLQVFILLIVENVVNHLQFRSLLTDAVGSSRQTPEFVNEENNGAQ